MPVNFGTIFLNNNPEQKYTDDLFAAVVANDLAQVNRLLEAIAVLKLPKVIKNIQSPHNRTVLHIASENGNLEMVKSLIKAGALAYAVDKHNVPALGYAATYGRSNIVIYLCSLPQVNPNTVRTGEFADEMPLMYAAWKCNMEAVEAIIKKGADVNAYKKSDNFTPAIYAIYNTKGKQEADKIISLLVKNGTVLDKLFKDNYNLKHGVQYQPPTNTGENESFYYTRKSRKRK
jgi:ankyrin repeat protein